jgi:extradiol dioxygenase family protein
VTPAATPAALERAPRFHLSLRVHPARLDAMIDFYATLFGVPPRKRHADHVQFDLVEPALNLSFVPTTAARTGELDHLGIQVFSEPALQAARRRLHAAGQTLREQPGVECCYARQDKFWLADPEGREVEVFHKLADLAEHGGQVPATASTLGTAAATAQANPDASTSACCAPGCCAPT